MTRRRLVALVSVAVLFTLGLIVVGSVLLVTRTTTGREKLRNIFVQPYASRALKNGTIYIGHLSGSLLTNVTVDSFSIKDKRGEILVATGRATFFYNPRDIVDQRLYITKAEVAHPYVHLIQHQSGKWNFQEIFEQPPSTTPVVPKELKSRSLGDYIVIDSTHATNGTFLLTLPWEPDPILKGAARDSAIRYHLTTPAKAVSTTFDGFGRLFAWRNIQGMITHARLADPDSDKKFGQQFHVASLFVDEYEPTFKFRNVTGDIQHLGDTIRFDIPHFDMPASTGHGKGRVWWGKHPVHYDIAIRGDSVSLDDVSWVYATLPRTGGGSLDLAIKNDPTNDRIIEYQLSKMDVRSTKSHLTGAMSFGTGEPVLLVRNVDLRADPADFDLLRTLAGGPFKQDWQGQLTGMVRGRGGPLTHFVIDESHATFNDAHVRGATSRFSGKGELDILEPKYTTFHSFFVDAGAVDLRTIEYLFPNFPRLHGIVSGTATLDSSWLDVRFSNAHLVHQDGEGEPSRVSGSGRITDGEPYVSYDMALNADPLSLTMIARSYPNPMRGLVSGPIRVKGIPSDLETQFSLQGALGSVSFDGRLDLDSIGGIGAHGRGEFSTLSPSILLANTKIPVGNFSGHYNIDLVGETAATLRGTADADIERTEFDSIRVYPSFAHLKFGDGRMTILDSLFLRTGAGTLIAHGGIGLPKGRPDSLRFDVALDSLGGLRRYISHPDTSRLGASLTLPDSLSGTLSLRGTAFGTMDSLVATGRLLGNNVSFNRSRVEVADVGFNFTLADTNVFGALSGAIDTVTLAGVVFDRIGALVKFTDVHHADFNATAISHNGPTANAAGSWVTQPSGGRNILLDSLGLSLLDDQWRLTAPVAIAMDSLGMRVDSAVLRNRDSASVSLVANIPEQGAASALLRASRVPLKDFGVLAQLSDTLNGVGDLTARVSGTKANPVVAADALLSSIKWGEVDLERVTFNAQYAQARANANLDVVRAGKTAVSGTASLPIQLTLPLTTTWRNDTISGMLRADSTDLSFLQLFVRSSVSQLAGRLTANLRVAGTPRAPVVNGFAAITNGSATVRPVGEVLSNINAYLIGGRDAEGRDSIKIDSIVATTAEKGLPVGHVKVAGWIKDLMRRNGEPSFDLALGASTFHVYNRRSVADVFVSTPSPADSLRLKGSVALSTLTGAIFVPRGSIFLSDPDLARKQAVQFIGTETPSSATSRPMSATVQQFMTNLVIQNVPVTLGSDVRLRSRDANVKLVGELQVLADRGSRTSPTAAELVPRPGLPGFLTTESGTYNLNLGPVQREFQVTGGTVSFDGPPENPILNIEAKYDVKQVRDLSVKMRLSGRLLPNPVIYLSNTGPYQIAASDLLSYLLIGSPGFDFGANANTQQILSSVLGPTASSVLTGQLRRSLGGWVDMVQLQLGTAPQTTTSNTNAFQQYLTGSTIGAEKQFGNVYLNLNTGFCQFTNGASAGTNPLNGVGAKAEYRFDPKLSFKLAYDPPTQERSCSTQTTLTGLAPTPANFSFSLSHVWRF